MPVDLGPTDEEEEAPIASPFASGVLALVVWSAVHLVLLGLWRPARPLVGPTPPLTEPSMLRVLRAVARHGSGEPLSRDVLVGAFSGLVRALCVELDDRGHDGVWVQPAERGDDGLLGPHELALLERIRMTSARAGGPVPLDSLRLAPEDDDAAWLRRTTRAAVMWARSVGLVRDHLPAPARALLRILLAVPVVLVTQAVVTTRGLHGVSDLVVAWAVAALVWWGLSRVLVTPFRSVVLTEAGRAVLAVAPPPHEDVPAWVLSVLGTPAGRQPAWTAAGRSWRTVDVDRSGVRGGGERPGVALYGSFLAAVLLLVAGIFLGVVTAGLLPTLRRTVVLDAVILVVGTGWLYGMGRVVYTGARAVADLRQGPETVVGHVVDRRQVAHGDDADRYYLVVDEGSGSVSTFLVTRAQFARAPEGAWIRVRITRRLDHVEDVELLTPTSPSSAVADMTLTLRRRRSRARDASV